MPRKPPNPQRTPANRRSELPRASGRSPETVAWERLPSASRAVGVDSLGAQGSLRGLRAAPRWFMWKAGLSRSAPHVHASPQHPRGDRPGRGSGARGALPGPRRRRGEGRAERLDAGGLSPPPRAADLAARPFRDRRHAARGQLDHPGAVAAPQGGAPRQGPGRGRAWALSLCRRRDAERLARGTRRAAARRPRQVLLDLQLPDADVGRHRRHRLARRRRRDHEPDPALPLLVWALRAGDDPHLQGGELPSAPGLRDHADALRAARRSRGPWRRTR